MIVYALVGIAGAPVFAQFSAGFGVILGKSGGFVLSYIPAAWLAGFILEKEKSWLWPLFACSYCRYDRHVCDRNDLYVSRIKCVAECTHFLSNHVVLYDLVYGERLRFDDIACDAGT